MIYKRIKKERRLERGYEWAMLDWVIRESLFGVLLYEERPKSRERESQAKKMEKSLRHTYTINIKVFTRDKLRILKK